MWHICTNNTTTILFPTQLWELLLLYTYHVIKQCIEKETTSLSIKLNYLHDLKIMFQCLLHPITYFIEITPNLHVQ